MDKKYILVEYMYDAEGNKIPDFYFGGYNKKYFDMIDITTRDCAYIFENKEIAEDTASSLNKGGYEFVTEEIQR